MADKIFNLNKDAPIFNLSKDADASVLNDLILGCGWKCKGFKDVDVDLSALVYDKEGNHVETVYFGNKKRWLVSGSFYHCGDDLTGSNAQTDIDNEQIKVKLSYLPQNIGSVYVVANVYSGNLKDLKSCYVCIRDKEQNLLLNSSMDNLTDMGVVLAAIVRGPDGWEIHRIDVGVNASTGSATRKFINAKTMNIDTENSFRRITNSQLSNLNGNVAEIERRSGFFARLFGRS